MDKIIVSADWSRKAEDWAWLEGGRAIPARFTFHAESPQNWTADFEVEVTGGRARTRSVKVTAAGPEGVTSTTMRQVPIRDLVAGVALNYLRRPVVQKDGTTKLRPFTLPETKEVHAVLERVVGYVDMQHVLSYVKVRQS
jgi:hypothetical protein